ncbi:MAG: sigma-70 family RNA polymerase sigma factor [Ruminococcaceae bacterium]|nr:sigma-70 family RNA polymerase sigma factor [Oscillospiraceae bacterium]
MWQISHYHSIQHLRDKPDCEECLNDTYLGTWNSIPPKNPSVLRVFLAKIMRNISLDKFRERHATRRVPSEMVSALEELRECTYYSPSVEEEYLVSELSRILNDYIEGLSERRQFIFVCRYYYADGIARIGGMLGISESTVYRELSEIRLGLKELLIKEGYFNE